MRSSPAVAASSRSTCIAAIETPDRYLLLVEWETLDDHVVWFRQSDAFTRWRALIGPYFASPPVADHQSPADAVGSGPGVRHEDAP